MSTKATKYLPLLILAIVVFALYFSTLARAIYLEDSAEFVTGAATLSIVHPSGYPTWLLLGKLASYLPIFNDIAARINFLSLIFAVAAVIFLYQSLQKLFKNTAIAFGLGLLFAIAPMVWLQATYAEVYSFNTLFLTLLFWLYGRFRQNPSKGRLYLLIFFYGLSLTNHFLMLPLAPLILIWLFYKFPPQRQAELYPKLLAVFLAGLIPYFYIPIRALGNPAFSWFHGNLERLVTYNLSAGYTISWNTLRYLSDLISFLQDGLGRFGLALLVAGILLMLYRRSPLCWLTVGGLFLFSIALLAAIVGGQEYTAFATWFYRYLYVPALLFALIPIGFLLSELYQSRFRLLAFYPALLILLIWPINDLSKRWMENNRSNFVFLERYTAALLSSLPSGATLFAHHDHILNDNIIFGLSFQRYGQKMRPDLTIRTLTHIFLPPDGFPIAEVKKTKKRLEIVGKYLEEKRDAVDDLYGTAPFPNTISNGFAYRFVKSGEKTLPAKTEPFARHYIPDNLYFPAGETNPFYQTIMAKWYYDHAARLYGEGKLRSGQWFLIKAIEYDPDPNSEYYRQIIKLRESYMRR